MIRNIYKNNNEFRLIDVEGLVLGAGGYKAFKNDPIQWDGIKFYIKRGDRHGVNNHFSDGELNVIFTKERGFDLIKKIYDFRGFDGKLKLQFVNKDTGEVYFEGRLMLHKATFKDLIEGVECPLQLTDNEKLKSRFDTPVTLEATEDLDGNSITGLTGEDIYLHGKVIKKEFEVRRENNINQEIDEGFGDEDGFANISLFDIQYNDFESYTPLIQIEENVSDIATAITTKQSGLFTFELNIFCYFYLGSSASSYSDMDVDFVIDVGGSKTVIYSENVPTVTVDDTKVAEQDFNISETRELQVNAGEEIKFYLEYTGNGAEGAISIVRAFDIYEDSESGRIKSRTVGDSYIKVTGNTREVGSTTKAYFIHETLDQIIQSITGQEKSLKSKFFGRTDLGYDLDGCDAYEMLTSGFKVRNFADKKVKFDLETLYESLKMIDAIGMGIEGNKVRLEHVNYFYQDEEIINLPAVSDYSRQVAERWIYNQVRFKYNTFAEEEVNTIDSFHTEHKYLTPVQNVENKLNLSSDVVLDPYTIEFQRRLQFKEDGKQSEPEDELPFMFNVFKEKKAFVKDVQADIKVSAGHFEIRGDYSLFSVSGSFTWTGNADASHDGLYLISDLDYDPNTDITTITVGSLSGSDATLTGEFEFADIRGCVSDEGYYAISGLISPETTYNLKNSIRRSLHKWRIIINAGLHYKRSRDKIKSTFVKNNEDLDFSATSPCTGIEPIGTEENTDIELQDFDWYNRVFVPFLIKFKSRLSWDDINTIKQAHDSGNNGYISWTNPEGKTEKGYLIELAYNMVNEEAEFEVIQKRIPVTAGPEPEGEEFILRENEQGAILRENDQPYKREG